MLRYSYISVYTDIFRYSSRNGWTTNTNNWSNLSGLYWYGVVELLRSIEVHKVAEPDDIPAHLLKETCDILSPSLTLIYQAH